MKKRFFACLMAGTLILPGTFLMTSCGEKNYKITFDFDTAQINAGYLQTEGATFNKSDLKDSSMYIMGYDLFDYSNLQVLVNGSPNSTVFVNKYQDSDSISGNTVSLGYFDFSKIDKDAKISLRGIKEKTVEVAFIQNTDDRLADKKTEYSYNYQQDDLENSNKMKVAFSNDFKIKLSDKDYNYLKSLTYDELKALDRTSVKDYTDVNGYTTAEWLFTDNYDEMLYSYENLETEDPDDYIRVFSPYFFEFSALDFFKPIYNTRYYYTGKNTSYDSDFKEESLPSGMKEYEYQYVSYNNSGSALFPIVSSKGFDYYDNLNGTNYQFNYSSSELTSIASNWHGGVSLYSNYVSNFTDVNTPDEIVYGDSRLSLNLYDRNLIVLDFSKMTVNKPQTSVSNLNTSNESPENESVDKMRQITVIVDMENFGVSNVDLSNATILCNGEEFKSNLGSFQYDEQIDGYNKGYIITINSGVLPIHFIPKEKLLNANANDFVVSENYQFTINNIDFSNATGYSILTVKCETDEFYNYPYYDDSQFFISRLYEVQNNGKIDYYFANEIFDQPNTIGATFNRLFYGDDAKNIELMLKNSNTEEKTVDVFAQAQKVLNGQLVGELDVDSFGFNTIEWNEGDFTVKVYYRDELTLMGIETVTVYGVASADILSWEVTIR